jgi:hypothetical protein
MPAGGVGDLGCVVAIYRLLQKSGLDPDDIKYMTDACERALAQLELKNREDPLTEEIAKLIFEVALTGEKDPNTICELALSKLRGTDREAC